MIFFLYIIKNIDMTEDKNNNNYYDILEVPNNAKKIDIEKSYKILVQKWHPDKKANKGNINVLEKYKKITEAYDILSDDKKRKKYDISVSKNIDIITNFENKKNKHDVNNNDIYEVLKQNGFNFNELLKKLANQMESKKSMPDLVYDIEINLSDSYIGKKIDKTIVRIDICKECNGNGIEKTDKNIDIKCKSCDGTSSKLSKVGLNCNKCKNTGINSMLPKCKNCHGDKGVPGYLRLDIALPIGIFHGCKIVLPNKGHEFPGNIKKIKRSNLVINIVEKYNENDEIENKGFSRGPEIMPGLIDPFDLLYSVNITFAESISGFYKEIEHIDGHKIKFSIPLSCRHGDCFIIKGEGMPKLKRTLFAIDDDDKKIVKENIDDDVINKFGNLFIQVNVEQLDINNISKDDKNKIIKLLNGKPLKIPPKIKLSEYITLQQYKKDEYIKLESDRMKNEYNKKKNKSNQESEQESDQESDQESNQESEQESNQESEQESEQESDQESE
jgi:DnaJ-class molecular chaperone